MDQDVLAKAQTMYATTTGGSPRLAATFCQRAREGGYGGKGAGGGRIPRWRGGEAVWVGEGGRTGKGGRTTLGSPWMRLKSDVTWG